MKKGLREIEFGYYAGEAQNKICIYDNGHIEPSEFLGRVASFSSSCVPLDARLALTAGDVKHTRFRPMSPSEARRWGADYGVFEAEDGRGYAVTLVLL